MLELEGGDRSRDGPVLLTWYSTSQLDSGFNDVVRIRKRLGKLSNWTGPVSRFALSVARSVEAVMNTIFSQKEYPELKTLE